jgi:hypothetical protein
VAEKTVFFYLELAVHNSHIIYNHNSSIRGWKKMTLVNKQKELVSDLCKIQEVIVYDEDTSSEDNEEGEQENKEEEDKEEEGVVRRCGLLHGAGPAVQTHQLRAAPQKDPRSCLEGVSRLVILGLHWVGFDFI